MTNRILLPRRFWILLGLTGVWGIFGGAAVGFLMGVPAGASFLLIVAIVLFVLTVSGRFVREREYSRGEGIVFLLAAPLILFAILPHWRWTSRW